MKVIIVGGVAGGATAAARIRRVDEHAEITIYERSGYISYANCGLPYFIGGEITDRTKLTLQTPQSFYKRFRVNVNTRHEVQKILRAERKVIVRNLDSGEVFEDTYDKLVLAPGATPAGMGIPGAQGDRVFTLRTVEDTFAIHSFVQKNRPQSAVVVGGGFIGLEIAENLIRTGLQVSLVEFASHVMAPFDSDMANQIHAQLKENGVQLHLNTGVKSFVSSENGVVVCTDKDEQLDADMAVLAVGVRAETSLAEDAGLKLGVKNTIAVNERMETSDPNIYAVGDAVETPNLITENLTVNALAGPANKQARIAADNICGGNCTYRGALATAVVKVFRMTAASTGLNEAGAKAAGIDYDKAVITSASHASYYPGAASIVLKVLFEKGTGKIIGAQSTGFDGVDKRIDVIATAIRAGMTAYDLETLDLAYAPPYSSAKDPVNMIGYVIENILRGKVKQFYWDEVAALPRDGSVVLLDVRTEQEYAGGHIGGFVNIPLDSLRERIHEIPAGKTVYVNCQSGLRSYIACRILNQNEFDCKNLSGGYGFYSVAIGNASQPEKGPSSCGKQ